MKGEKTLKSAKRPSLSSACFGVKRRLEHSPSYRNVGILRRWYYSPTTMARDVIRLLGPRPEGHSMDRKNPYGHYTPNNLRWASEEVQRENRVSNVPLRLTAGESYDLVIPQDEISERERKRRHGKYRKSKGISERQWRERNRDRYLKQLRNYRRKRMALKKSTAVPARDTLDWVKSLCREGF